MSDLFAVIYGLLQGVTEFLPVSSSAHLALLPHLFKFKDPGVFFDLAMHVGTAIAIFCYFYKEIFSLLKELMYLFIPGHKGFGQRYWLVNMIISVGATAVFYILLKDLANSYGRNPLLISVNLILFGAFLFFADRFEQGSETMHTKESWKKALIIGLAQTAAIFPGVSRSGITITAARFLKISRVESSKYSFLLALPPIFAGIILKYNGSSINFAAFEWRHVIIGSIISFIVAILTIHLFLKWIQKIGFQIFFFYRILLGVSVYFLFT